ncbi:hypothetical protein EDB80DRAFT_751365 [Ilyonectria destructans]|nr:hypothetical protein EDB80DRAFT_751365 [Ilyonectria destructans]
MEGAADEIFPPQERPRTGGLQGDTARTRPFPQSSSYNSFSTGDQFNAPGGTQNISNGSGNQFPGATFQQPVYFNTNEHFDPLRDCLRSLAFPEMDSRFNDIDAAANGTCEWLLQHETYTSWASRDRGLLWIKGKPGSGKSTLLRYVLGRAMAIPNSREGALILSFFFHGRGSELQKMPLGLFRSLLHQLLRQVPEALTGLVDTFKQRCETVGKAGEKWQWHPGELLRLFESSLPKVLETRPVWLFVDALDECGKDNAVKLVEDFESMLHSLPSSDLKQFRICFTCRHYPILGLDGVFEVCVEEENWKDISAFVQDKLSSFRKRTSSTIPDLITNRADGVFLWAWLMVEQVLDLEREGVGLKKIEAVILSVPQELDALYHELIRNMASDSLKLVQWICFAMRPLSLNELRWAMLVDADCPHRSLYECQSAGDYPFDDDGMKRRVQTLSRGLAEVTSDAKVVQFIHQSVKDFFVEKDLSALDETAKPDFVVGMAHHRLSRTCIRYLEMEEIGQSAIRESDHLRSEFPFLHYATTSWIVHVKQSETKASQGGLPDHFSGVSEAIVQRWARIYRIIEPFSSDQPPEKISTAHIVSRYQLIGQLRLILKRVHQVRTYVNAKDEYGRTPLLYAAERGYLAVVKELLENGADPNSGDDEGRTPLLYAAERGYLAVVKELWLLLLDDDDDDDVSEPELR